MVKARARRVGEQIGRYLSAKLIPSLRDPRLGFSTITGIEVSPDLKSARVFVTILEEDPVKRADALAALNGAAGHFRSEISRGLQLRYSPSLRFLEDVSVERGDRIERLIQEIHRSPGPHGEDEFE